MTQYWNERYSQEAYVYGEAPNEFFAAQLKNTLPGTMVLPCEGEGRNAVYAASLGWKVYAFDTSDAGMVKANALAAKKGVTINYQLADALTVNFAENSIDIVALIYAHFPPEIRKTIHQRAIKWLKPGGKIILEAFNPAQLNNNSGGPKAPLMLYTENMVAADFIELKTALIHTAHINLKEGKFHDGIADVLRYVGIKK